MSKLALSKLGLIKPAPLQLRGPFMARVWLLLALTIVGIQMVFLVNLLVRNDTAVDWFPAPVPASHEQPPTPAAAYDARWDTVQEELPGLLDKNDKQADKYVPEVDSKDEIEGGKRAEPPAAGNMLAPPPAEAGQPTGSGNSQIFDLLQSLVMSSFQRHGADPAAASGGSLLPAAPSLQLGQMLPLLSMLPSLPGGPSLDGLARVDWAAQAPLLGRLQHFAEFCSGVFTATVAEMKRRYPAKTQQPAFVSAVAMKSFFRIFALEDTQDTFLELLDEAGALLEVMGMTNLVSDLLSGHLYEQMLAPGKLTAAGNGGSVGLGGLADLFLSAPALRSATSTTTAVSAAGEQEAEEEEMDNSAAFVSNEQFEGIMELYDSMFRDDETRNATAAKLELAGRVFLQGWYESMRRFGRERGKLAPKPFTPADFANYMEAIEVPFSNIIDFAYPLNNERACDGPPEVTLVAVLSRSRNAALRRAIRQTWAVPTALGGGLKVVFLMSDRETERPALRQESEEFRDIVTVDVPETYDYLPRRVLALLDWASRYCAAAAYVFKTTEQVYLNATLLREQVDFAKKAGAAESADAPVQIVGNLVKNASVERNPLFLQHLFYDEYPFDSLPTHLRGFGYLLSRDFAKQAVAVAKDFPLMRTDDLLVSAILANKLKVAPHAFQKGQRVYALGRGQLTQPDTRKVKEEVCREKRDTLVFGGKLDAPEMLLLHEYLLSCPA